MRNKCIAALYWIRSC